MPDYLNEFLEGKIVLQLSDSYRVDELKELENITGCTWMNSSPLSSWIPKAVPCYLYCYKGMYAAYSAITEDGETYIKAKELIENYNNYCKQEDFSKEEFDKLLEV